MIGDRKESKGRYMTGKQVDNYLNWQAEIKQLRKVVKVVEDAVKTHIAWQAGKSQTTVVWDELAWQLHDMIYKGEEE